MHLDKTDFCVAETAAAGILKGKKYYRFESPWGAKGFTSLGKQESYGPSWLGHKSLGRWSETSNLKHDSTCNY